MEKTKGRLYYGQNDPKPRLIIAVTEWFVYFLPALPDAVCDIGIEEEEFICEMFVLKTGKMTKVDVSRYYK